MTQIQERGFHLLMGALLVAACYFDRFMANSDLAWKPPEVGFVALTVGMVWIGRYAAWRSELTGERLKVMNDRIERLERKNNALEDELRAHRPAGSWPAVNPQPPQGR